MQPISPQAKYPRFHRVSRFEAGRSFAVLFLLVVAAVGCGDKMQPAAPIPPCPPTTCSTTRQPSKVYSDPILQRLSKAGALIDTDAHGKDGGRYVMVLFRDAEIDSAATEDLSRLFNPVRPAASGALAADRPIHLVFERCCVSHKALGAWNGARRLDGLSFVNTHVEDGTFAHVEALPALRDLTVDDSRIGDDGLRFLARSPALRMLSARRTRVGDATLARIASMKSIQMLELTGTQVTDRGVRSIRRLPMLLRLDVSNCNITDRGAAYLAELRCLDSLNIAGTRITDAGVGHLTTLDLTILSLKNTDTSDACLKNLSGMRHIGCLDITGTRITPEAAVTVLGISRFALIRDP